MEIQGVSDNGIIVNDGFFYYGVKNKVNMIRSEVDEEDCSIYENYFQCFLFFINFL